MYTSEASVCICVHERTECMCLLRGVSVTWFMCVHTSELLRGLSFSLPTCVCVTWCGCVRTSELLRGLSRSLSTCVCVCVCDVLCVCVVTRFARVTSLVCVDGIISWTGYCWKITLVCDICDSLVLARNFSSQCKRYCI